MQTFIMLTRLTHGALKDPEGLTALEQKVKERIAAQCPDVKWAGSYAVLGPYDYLDIFQAPYTETATKVSMIVRTYGHADTEIWPATEWKKFKEMIAAAPSAAA